MNQILSVEPPSKNNKKPNTKAVTKVFAIGMLILGILILAVIGYLLYNKAMENKKVNKPTIFVSDDDTPTEINIKVTSNTPLSRVTYQWNQDEEVDMKAEGKRKIEELVTIPNGTNDLTITAVDANGKETKYNKRYTVLGDISINITTEGKSIKVVTEGKKELQYLTYRWDDQEETRIEIRNNKKEQLIDIPEGLHKLTVVVVDVDNKTEKKEQEVKGVTAPKLEISTDGTANFIIKCNDAEGISKIELTLNNGETEIKDIGKELPIEQRKEYELKYPFKPGENKLKVKVFNESGISTVKGAKVSF